MKINKMKNQFASDIYSYIVRRKLVDEKKKNENKRKYENSTRLLANTSIINL